MKESVYGWYPPARDIWKTYRQQTYEAECLYKHQDSRYNDKPGVPTPVVPTPLRTSHPARPSRSRGSGGRPRTHTPQTEGLRIQSVAAELHDERGHDATPKPHPKSATPTMSASRSPVKLFSPTPSSLRTSGSPKKAWATKVPETQVCIPEHPAPHVTRFGSSMSPQVGTTHRPPSSTSHHITSSPIPPPPHCSGSARPSRIQSATTSRARVTPPARPTKSAGPIRSAPIQEVEQGPVVAVRKEESPVYEMDDDSLLGVDDPLDYNEQLEKYGWRMEIPGDPLNLKRTCIPKRLPITCKLAEPTIKPNPPTGKMENFETYFYNTIPRRRATFAVHKEWVSEVLLAKRIELQKRDGDEYKYRHTNFSFAY